MAFDEKAAERVRRALGNRRAITEKKMMGALCFMTGGTMCCGVTGSALMIRVGAEDYERALAKPHVRPMNRTPRRPRLNPDRSARLPHSGSARGMGRARPRYGESSPHSKGGKTHGRRPARPVS